MIAKWLGPATHRSCGRLRVVGVLVVQIVVTDVNYRQLPQRCYIHGFVEDALAERTISEEAGCYLAGAAHFARHGGSGSNACAAANDGVGAQVAGFLVRDVHGAALAPAVTCFFAEQFGKHPIDRSALCQAVPVAAMHAGDVVIAPQALSYSHHYGFFTSVEAAKPRHFCPGVHLVY